MCVCVCVYIYIIFAYIVILYVYMGGVCVPLCVSERWCAFIFPVFAHIHGLIHRHRWIDMNTTYQHYTYRFVSDLSRDLVFLPIYYIYVNIYRVVANVESPNHLLVGRIYYKGLTWVLV